MSFDFLCCVSTCAARGGEGCLGGWRDADPGDGAILGGEGGDGGKEGGKEERSPYAKSTSACQACHGLPGPPQAWHLLIFFEIS